MSAIRFPLAFLLPALLLGACAAQNGGASRDGVPIAERIGLTEPAAPGVAPRSFAPMDAGALGPETGKALGRTGGELRRGRSYPQPCLPSHTVPIAGNRARTLKAPTAH